MVFFVILVANSRKIKTLSHGKEHVIAWTEHGVFPRVPFCLMLLGFFGKMWFVSVKAGKYRKNENEKLRQCPYLEPNQRHMCIMGLQSVSSRNVASHIGTQASATVRSLNYFYPSVPIMRPWRIIFPKILHPNWDYPLPLSVLAGNGKSETERNHAMFAAKI